MERDIKEQWTLMAIRISTHTLTWSVTLDRDNNFNPTIDSNSHAHVERDVCVFAIIIDLLNFNSHAHVERDGYAGRRQRTVKISTHTLTWSVT